MFCVLGYKVCEVCIPNSGSAWRGGLSQCAHLGAFTHSAKVLHVLGFPCFPSFIKLAQFLQSRKRPLQPELVSSTLSLIVLSTYFMPGSHQLLLASLCACLRASWTSLFFTCSFRPAGCASPLPVAACKTWVFCTF